MLGINGAELVVIIVLVLVLIGPEKLPQYAAQLGSLVRQGKGFVRDAKDRVDEEFGEDLRDVDWTKLDPRQYDPRRIVKEALLDDDGVTGARPGRGGSSASRSAAGAATVRPAPAGAVPGLPAPFDDEAT